MLIHKFLPAVEYSLKYNRSIDGLRGIAVIIVVLFHIWPDLFSFGYVGVDIFFVLSGFLITKIIYTQLESGSFSFVIFYRNRIRRILPAMLIVVLFTAIFGYLFLFPSELKILSSHIESSVFFYQNFRLTDEAGYWDLSSQLKPLLHCWSLSIEEQFYVIWPFLIFLMFNARVRLLPFFVSIVLLFLIIPQFFNIDYFYHSFSRFWQLSFGGLVFAATYNKNYFRKIENSHWIVFVLFVISIVISYDNSEYSLFRTILITFFTGFVLVSISPNNNRNNLLTSRILVFLGLISYSLYLWHYVLISYCHILNVDVAANGIFILFLSISLSYFTYRFVEFYSRKNSSLKFTISLATIAIFIGVAANYTDSSEGFPGRWHLPKNRFSQQFVSESAKDVLGESLVHKILGYEPPNDYVKATSADITKRYVLVTGDSHAHTSYPGFADEFKKIGYETLLVANISCPPYPEAPMGTDMQSIGKCDEKIKAIYSIIDKNNLIEKIIFATRGPKYMYGLGYGIVDGAKKPPYSGSRYSEFFLNREEWDQKNQFLHNIESLFDRFNLDNRKLYYLIENPELGFHPRNCQERPFDIFPSTCTIKYSDYISRSGEYRNYVTNLAATRFGNVTLLDPLLMYCDYEYCYAVKDGKMLYFDDDHHSVDGSTMQAKYLIDKIFPDMCRGQN